MLFIAVSVTACKQESYKLDFAEKERVKYCIYTYTIGDSGMRVPICSQYELTRSEVQFMDDQFMYSCYHYRRFIEAKGYEVPESTDISPSVYMTTFKHLNDREYFPRKDPNVEILGRYINRRGDIFLTDIILRESNSVTASHEYGHWFNDIIGIYGDRNEKLAQEFEIYYKKKIYGVR